VKPSRGGYGYQIPITGMHQLRGRDAQNSVDPRIEKTSYARSQAYQQWGTGYSGLEARSHVFPPLWALPFCGCLNADLVVTHPLDTVGRLLPTVTVLQTLPSKSHGGRNSTLSYRYRLADVFVLRIKI
jgi:hypothetical protein